MEKKIFIALLLVMLTLGANAQYVSGLDETDLIGKWDVVSIDGNLDDFFIEGTPEYFNFTNRYSTIKTTSHYYYYKGFFVSNGNTKLHLVATGDEYWVNLKIYRYSYIDNVGDMVLKTYDNSCTITLAKNGISGVNSAKVNPNQQGSTMYDLQGRRVENPKGVYIQSGKKYVGK